MLDRLPLDIICYIFNNLNEISDVFTLTSINTSLNLMDDSYFKLWSIKHFGEQFWKLANKRSKSISQPLKTMKLELIRIGKFQMMLQTNNIKWTNLDYYNYWQTLENIRINNKNPRLALLFRI